MCGIIEQTEGTAGIYPEGDKMKVKQLGTLQIFKVLSSWVMSEWEASASQTTCD